VAKNLLLPVLFALLVFLGRAGGGLFEGVPSLGTAYLLLSGIRGVPVLRVNCPIVILRALEEVKLSLMSAVQEDRLHVPAGGCGGGHVAILLG
jgi:hypothetical protein